MREFRENLKSHDLELPDSDDYEGSLGNGIIEGFNISGITLEKVAKFKMQPLSRRTYYKKAYAIGYNYSINETNMRITVLDNKDRLVQRIFPMKHLSGAIVTNLKLNNCTAYSDFEVLNFEGGPLKDNSDFQRVLDGWPRDTCNLHFGDHPYLTTNRDFRLRLSNLKEGNIRMEDILARCYQEILVRLTEDKSITVEYPR